LKVANAHGKKMVSTFRSSTIHFERFISLKGSVSHRLKPS
jgi:hypothetical protein